MCSIAGRGVFVSACDFPITFPIFVVVSLILSNFLVIGDRLSVNFILCVCLKFLFLISRARWFYCCSASLHELVKSCSVTIE